MNQQLNQYGMMALENLQQFRPEALQELVDGKRLQAHLENVQAQVKEQIKIMVDSGSQFHEAESLTLRELVHLPPEEEPTEVVSPGVELLYQSICDLQDVFEVGQIYKIPAWFPGRGFLRTRRGVGAKDFL